MRNLLMLTVIFLSSVVISQAQDKKDPSYTIINSYQQYFELPRETIFLHLNKSTYLVGEEIWFKGYIYDRQKNTPATKTSNIHIGIYDDKGNQVDKKLFLGFNGYTRGNIAVDSTFASGEYYIKASTNWMRNFTEDDSFVQKIRIVNKKAPQPDLGVVKYDLQLLPEGGHLIEGIENTLGFKLTDQNGFGVEIEKGALMDADGNTLLEFKANSFGMGKFAVTPQKEQSYKVVTTLFNGEKIEVPFPEVKDKGIGVSVNNQAKENVIIALRTNDLTLEDIDSKKFQLLIHKNGKYSRTTIPFKMGRKNTLISFKRENLFKGINIITLFDENGKPLLERIFFNDHNIEYPTVSVTNTAIEGDSINIKFKFNGKAKNLQNFSVSVLPEDTRSYEHRENILSAFFLKPYLKGFVENPAYYFKDIDSKKSYDLDILLLTQGWSRYDWGQIFNHSPKQLFKFKNGITLKGSLNEKDLEKYNELYIFSAGGQGSKSIELSGPQFEINNLFLKVKDTLRLSLINKKNDLVKPKLSANPVPETYTDKIGHLFKSPFYRLNNPSVPEGFLSDKVTALDEVVLKEKRKEIKDPDALGPQQAEVVDEEFIERYFYINQYIESKGYAVRTNHVRLDPDEGLVSINLKASRTVNASTQPALYVNGIVSFDYDLLFRLPSSAIEKIIVDQSGYGAGLRGGNGVIKIWLRNTPLVRSSGKSVFPYVEIPVQDGFEEHKKFYTPKYQAYTDRSFQDYGVIHWSPDVITDENGEAVIKIFNTKLNNISFFIEGMASDGSIISSSKKLQIK
ncbi:hypothetical protein GWK08_11750 [Leptobacterium flavescens]|uniref:TonB-dependent receptor plug domain-containing protein n=1 Tax=Leptobacterium flavescens TaxID=472055 RepID=A0A6P0UQ61_9FLAO|nr:hypothetical protein [Leptobacterium flavescens]NER14118.1 hypothetical protein [Leptobacterium flavescens]